MKDFNLRLYLKDNLPKQKCPEYLNYLADIDPYHEGHHILGKAWDYLIAKITTEEHKLVHAGHPSAPSFEELLVNAIRNWSDYMKYINKKDELDKLSELF